MYAKRVVLVLVALEALMIFPVHADQAAGSACAKNLPADAQRVYALAAPDVKPGVDLPSLVRGKLVPVVQSGQMTRDAARSAAQTAGPCLKALQN